MIEAKALRDGNYIFLTKDGFKSKKVYQLDAYDIYKASESECEDIKPIPLTEEWHNKFGVEINGHMSFEYLLPRNNNIKVKIVFTGDYVYLIQGDKPMDQDVIAIWNKDLTKRDMFVHEFQNLYSILSGVEELTISK
ncbi:MAG: hypothetical protein HRT87_01265 [Legionellales bacterium]|nr:hypothetical protein [Legionellales bacterium]